MSVSFSPSWVESGTFVVVCGCGSSRSAEFESWAAARSAITAKAGIPVCDDLYCRTEEYLFVEKATPDPEVNVSNVNAATLLDVLGVQVGEHFSDRCSGSLPADDFLGRVLVAMALNPADAGVPSTQSGNSVDCGRRDGYVDERLVQLKEIAEFAVAEGREVCWA